MTRQQQLNAIYRRTHRDYRSVVDGERCILLLLPNQGTCLVPLASLTDEQIKTKMERKVP